MWGSWKKQLQRGVTPLYSAPLTFLEGVRQRWDSPGLLKVMDVLIFASAHMSSSCRTNCLLHPHVPVLEASGTPVIPVLPASHLSLCTRVLHYFRDFHPVPWGLHLLSQVPNLFCLSFCRNHFDSLPIWLASLRCPSDPWPFAHSSHSQSGTEHFCKGQCWIPFLPGELVFILSSVDTVFLCAQRESALRTSPTLSLFDQRCNCLP